MNEQSRPSVEESSTVLWRKFVNLIDDVNAKIVGQQKITAQVVQALLADGHVILQGPPGVAKTRLARLLFSALEGTFKRIQFTPDLLPSDLIGGAVLNNTSQQFEFHRGPLFANYILADEINRAPAKVQSALLEAMEERQISSGEESYPLTPPFFVIATQNPIEHDGTWDLPQAQLDRFLLQVEVDYPRAISEREILDLVLEEGERFGGNEVVIDKNISHDDLLCAQQKVREVHIAEPVRDYIVRLLCALRSEPTPVEGICEHLSHPASPRGSIALAAVAKAKAWLDGRDYVVPEDVQELAVPVLAHRIALNYHAEADGIQADVLIARLIDHVSPV